MFHYEFEQWLLFFFLYCFIGWVYESIEVSIRQKKLTNRGFLRGPWLPIYGSGAVVILFSTLPFSKSPIAVFFVGMISCTVLEYVTGVVMLELFKVRYWDYSYRKIQFQGHICLAASLIWGGFSLLMVYVIHPPVAHFVSTIPMSVVKGLGYVLAVVFGFDFVYAFRDAMDLRKMIIEMQKLKEQLKDQLDERVNDFMEEVEAEKVEFQHKVEEGYEDLRENLLETRTEIEARLEMSLNEKKERQEERKARMQQSREELEARIEELRVRMERPSKWVLIHNPDSGIKGMKDETDLLRNRFKMKK